MKSKSDYSETFTLINKAIREVSNETLMQTDRVLRGHIKSGAFDNMPDIKKQAQKGLKSVEEEIKDRGCTPF